MKQYTRIDFAESTDVDIVENLLESAIVAVESITGQKRLKADASVDFDEDARRIDLEVRGPAGVALRRSLLGLLAANLNEDEYRVSHGQPCKQTVDGAVCPLAIVAVALCLN